MSSSLCLNESLLNLTQKKLRRRLVKVKGAKLGRDPVDSEALKHAGNEGYLFFLSPERAAVRAARDYCRRFWG